MDQDNRKEQGKHQCACQTVQRKAHDLSQTYSKSSKQQKKAGSGRGDLPQGRAH